MPVIAMPHHVHFQAGVESQDVSIVVTDCDKDNKEKKHDTKNFKSPSVSEIEDAAKRWKDKYGNGETAININDYK